MSVCASPRVALRVDASYAIGTGHLRRCLSLAHTLRKLGADVYLLVRRLDGVAPQILSGDATTAGLVVRWLPAPTEPCELDADGPPHQRWSGVTWSQDASDTVAALDGEDPDWLVVDHYALDSRWHVVVRQGLRCRLLCIDDVADRELDVDILLDQNWDADHRTKYLARLRREPLWLTGPRYALLSESYLDTSTYCFRDRVHSIGIFVGGTDTGSASAQVLRICRQSGFAGPIEIVSTLANPCLDELRAVCDSMPDTYLTLDEPNLAGFFARHDLQVGAGGVATWERCRIGVPTIALVLAANQMAVVPALDKLGVLRAARLDPQAALDDIPVLPDVLVGLLSDTEARSSMADKATRLVDGRGAQRVALRLLSEHLYLRPADEKDGKTLHRWRNHSSVRWASWSDSPTSLDDHMSWLRAVLVANDRWLFVAAVGPLLVGSIRFDLLSSGRLEVSLYLDPALQGLGLGRSLLLTGEQTMLQILKQDIHVHAKVRPENSPSQHLFSACGYRGGPSQYVKAIGLAGQLPKFQ